MQVLITDKVSHFSIDLLDASGKSLKTELSFDKNKAELQAKEIADERIAIAESNNEEIGEIPIIWLTPVTVLQRLLFCLEESHTEEIMNNHFGDDRCSYCREIARAKEMLAYHHLQPLEDLPSL